MVVVGSSGSLNSFASGFALRRAFVIFRRQSGNLGIQGFIFLITRFTEKGNVGLISSMIRAGVENGI